MGGFDPRVLALMLLRLVVEDFELIERAELVPAAGLTAITGETGSGKTMLLNAIEFALGARASSDAVRKGRRRARVALEIEPDDRVREVLAAQGIELEDDEVVVVRELEGGKTTGRINGVPVSAAQLRALGLAVAEIVGQHEAQRLLAPAQQLDALDRFGGAKTLSLRERVAAAHERHGRLRDELATLEADEGRALADADFAAFAAREIADAALEEGEDERLRERRDLLANAERIAGALRAASDSLAEEERFASAVASLATIARFGAGLDELARDASALQGEIGELSARIGRQLESIDLDPNELETVTARLALIDRLKKKYGGTIEAVGVARRGFDEIVERAATSDERQGRLRAEAEVAAAELDAACADLTKARAAAARACESRVTAELAALAMPAARFAIAFEPLAQPGPNGAERCEFRLSANPGEPLRPLARGASGGELSRVMLALSVVLADRTSRVALVFDEIDAGIGGATANAVGARLADLATHTQVVCVTHLAQIAVFAGAQFALRKREAKGATTIELVALDEEARLAEIARMLSGATTGVSLEHARTLMRERATPGDGASRYSSRRSQPASRS